MRHTIKLTLNKDTPTFSITITGCHFIDIMSTTNVNNQPIQCTCTGLGEKPTSFITRHIKNAFPINTFTLIEILPALSLLDGDAISFELTAY